MIRLLVQRFVLRTGRLPPALWIYRLAYRLAFAVVRVLVSRRSEVLQVSARRGFLSGEFIPGSSDIDILVMFRRLAPAEEERFLRWFWAFYERLRRWLPFLGEAQVLTEDEARAAAAWSGTRSIDYPDAPARDGDAWRERIDRASESLAACLFLLQDVFYSADRSDPAHGAKLAKGFLDSLRFIDGPEADRVPSRMRQRSALAPHIRARLVDAENGNRDAASALVATAIHALDARCEALIERARAEGLTEQPGLPAPEPWPDDVPNAEIRFWCSRFRRIENTTALGAACGMYYDGGSRWYLLAGASEERNLRIVVQEAALMRAQDPVFTGRPLVVSPTMFQLLLWTAHLDSPLRYMGLAPRLGPTGVSMRRRSRRPLASWDGSALRVQWRIESGGFAPPPRRLLDIAAVRSAADLARGLRLFASGFPSGDNAYRLCHLYGRLLSLALLRSRGVASDPDDLDRLIELWREHRADRADLIGPLLRALDIPAREFNRRPAADCFYEHSPTYAALLAEVLPRSEGSLLRRSKE